MPARKPPAAKEPIDATAVQQAILLGRCDDDLASVFEAVQMRALATGTVTWEFSYDEVTFDETNLSPLDIRDLCRLLRCKWVEFDFRNDQEHQVALLQRMLVKLYGKSEAEADEWIDTRPFSRVVQAFGFVNVPS